MIRRIVILASKLSLLLSAATVVLWLWSFESVVQVTAYREHRYSASLDRGQFLIERCTCSGEFHDENGPVWDRVEYTPNWTFVLGWCPKEEPHQCNYPPTGPAYFGDRGSSRPSQESADELAAGPVWPIALLTAIPALLLVVVRRISRIRIRPGYCRTCGYDLQASSVRCPECGTAITQRAQATA